MYIQGAKSDTIVMLFIFKPEFCNFLDSFEGGTYYFQVIILMFSKKI